MIGKQISHYRILQKLGEGGMGVVYKAEDTQLKRFVALKFLPTNLTQEEDAKKRFIREAQAASALDHPNICAIHSIEQTDEQETFICMAHYDGETLKDKIKRGPLPLLDAIDIATQIVQGLARAHEAGIIHRDIKPGNVIITERDEVKILDFGLAKLAGQTITKSGSTLGTVAYMSPEQVQGRTVDERTDVWAWGVVLYEMLTGELPFKGEYDPAIQYAIVHLEPEPLTQTRSDVPQELEQVVERTLAKEPQERYQHAGELAVDLKRTLHGRVATKRLSFTRPPWLSRFSLQQLITMVILTGRARWKQLLPWGFVAILALIIAILTLTRNPFVTPTTRFAITLPPSDRLPAGAGRSPDLALSPDGKQLVYVAIRGGSRQLFHRGINDFEAKPIPGSEGGGGPFFSPNGEWIGFFAEGKLKKASLLGGPPITLCDAPGRLRGASWGHDDNIFFSLDDYTGLSKVSSDGGESEVLTTVDHTKGEHSHQWPEVLSNSNAVLFSVATTNAISSDDARIALLVPGTGEYRVLIEGGSNPKFVTPGYIVFNRAAQLLAAPFDVESLEVTGSPVPIVSGVQMSKANGGCAFSISDTGTLIYVPGGTQSDRTLVWVNRQGTERPIPLQPDGFAELDLSPDGQRLAINVGWTNHNLWIYGVARNSFTRLTFEADNHRLLWAPDGKHVTFSSNMHGGRDIFWIPADGSGVVESLVTSQYQKSPSSWSPDGKVLAYTALHPTTKGDIWTISLDGEPTPKSFLQTRFYERYAHFSPDGRWIAYASNETGRREVYVRPYPGSGRKWQISNEGGDEPVWAASGRELFFRKGNKIMAVTTETGLDFTVGKPRLLFEGSYPNWIGKSYDVTPDAQSFVLIKNEQQRPRPTQLNVVLNWFEEIEQAFGGGN